MIEEGVLQLANRRATEEKRPLNDLIEDALISYLSRRTSIVGDPEAAYRVFCEQPMKISNDQFKQLLGEDRWDV
jgi:hypothetical protein